MLDKGSLYSGGVVAVRELTKENLKELTLEEIARYRFYALSDEQYELIFAELERRGVELGSSKMEEK